MPDPYRTHRMTISPRRRAVDIWLTWALVVLLVPFTAVMVAVYRADSEGAPETVFSAAQPGDQPGDLCPHCLDDGYRALAIELYSEQNFIDQGFVSRLYECPRCYRQWRVSWAMGVMVDAPWLTPEQAQEAKDRAVEIAVEHERRIHKLDDMIEQHRRQAESETDPAEIPRVRIAE